METTELRKAGSSSSHFPVGRLPSYIIIFLNPFQKELRNNFFKWRSGYVIVADILTKNCFVDPKIGVTADLDLAL